MLEAVHTKHMDIHFVNIMQWICDQLLHYRALTCKSLVRLQVKSEKKMQYTLCACIPWHSNPWRAVATLQLERFPYVNLVTQRQSDGISPSSQQPSRQELRWSPGNVLASRSKVRGFKSGWGRWIFSGRKNPEHNPSGGTLSWGSRVWDFRLVKEAQAWKNRPLSKL